MKSVLMRPPPSAYSILPSCVAPRLPPSPTTRARMSLPLIRTESFARSPTSEFDSFDDFTYVPMPPFHSRSTGAFRMALISSFGVMSWGASSGMPTAARTSGDGVTLFALRSMMSPAGDIFDRS